MRHWMNYEFVECKTWGHAWSEYDGADYTITPYRAARCVGWIPLRCDRCRSRKIVFVDEDGSTVGTPVIKHTPGYRDAVTDHKPTRNELRLFIIKRRI